VTGTETFPCVFFQKMMDNPNQKHIQNRWNSVKGVKNP
jgi:hypothetical protein